MIDKFMQLQALGAGDFAHIDGSLLDHLNGTRELLRQWGANTALQDAGLFHAAYGTAGFSHNLVSIDQRKTIADIIGTNAEEIVYQYCACERNTFFAVIGETDKPQFPNRFTGKRYFLTESLLSDFCELTAANEVEIARNNKDFLDQHGAGLKRIFKAMTPHLSLAARHKTAEVFEVA